MRVQNLFLLTPATQLPVEPQFSAEMLANCVLLHVLSTLTLVQFRTRPKTGVKLLTLFVLFHSLTWLILGTILWTQSEVGERVFDWRMRPFSPVPVSGILDPISLRFDIVRWPILVVLPILPLTCCWQTRRSSPKVCSLSFLLLGATVLTVSNDVLTMMAGSAAVMFSLTFLAEKQGESVLRQQFIGWSCIFAGLAWLVACAAFVRSAPHGLPGASSTIISDLTSLIQRSTAQHPAADFLWKQYQLLPALSIILGVGFLSGLTPFHTQFVRLFEQGTFKLRICLLLVSKLAFLLMFQLLVEPDLESWQSSSEVLAIPALLGLMYSSSLVMVDSNSSLRIARIVVWSQHVTFFLFVTVPDAGLMIILFSSLTQLAALVLLSLREECVHEENNAGSGFTYGLIGISMIVLTSGGVGHYLLWQASLPLSTENPLGATKLVLFTSSLLISMTGFLRYIQNRDKDAESTDIDTLDRGDLFLLMIWSFIAIATSFAIPVYCMIAV